MPQSASGVSCMNLALFTPGQWHFQQNNAPVHNSILVTDYLTKMGINTVPHPPYRTDLAPCDFWLFPKLTGCRYERNEAVQKFIDTLTQEDLHSAFQKLLERLLKIGMRSICMWCRRFSSASLRV